MRHASKRASVREARSPAFDVQRRLLRRRARPVARRDAERLGKDGVVMVTSRRSPSVSGSFRRA
jgi:hypothetical protein